MAKVGCSRDLAKKFGVSVPTLYRFIDGLYGHEPIKVPEVRGAHHANCVLTPSQIRKLKAERKKGATFFSLAKKYGCSVTTARNAVLGWDKR